MYCATKRWFMASFPSLPLLFWIQIKCDVTLIFAFDLQICGGGGEHQQQCSVFWSRRVQRIEFLFLVILRGGEKKTTFFKASSPLGGSIPFPVGGSTPSSPSLPTTTATSEEVLFPYSLKKTTTRNTVISSPCFYIVINRWCFCISWNAGVRVSRLGEEIFFFPAVHLFSPRLITTERNPCPLLMTFILRRPD